VIPQAVLAGVPVVCYDLDGSSEVIDDGVNGYLVPPRDHYALADRLRLLAHSPALRTQLGGATRDRVLRQFSDQMMASKLLRLYADPLSNPRYKRRGT
jgi:glycosyltransferase involved in cell wall biosynthesis